MWRELQKHIAVSEAEIAQLIAFHRELLDAGKERPLLGIELSAAAAFLHSLYSGIENLFRRISLEVDKETMQSGDWHQRLLRAMTQPATLRPSVISEELAERLKTYLQFRHMFRNIYVFRLEWARLEPLILGVEPLVADLKLELAAFVVALDEMWSTPSDL